MWQDLAACSNLMCSLSLARTQYCGATPLPPHLASVLSDPGNFLSPVIVVLGAHTKQFKDSNFNVLKASFLAISSLLEAAHAAGGAKGNRAAVSIVVAPAVEKLGDRKLQVNKKCIVDVHRMKLVVACLFLSSCCLFLYIP